jgi:photosystem II stability/assembly factor-like uncharacterized protein
MSQNNYTPALTSTSRAFLISGRAKPSNKPSYASYLKATGPSKKYGDLTKVEMPDPSNSGQFIEVGTIQGSSDRVTFSLVGRYAMALKSQLKTLADQSCPFDVQVHLGACSDPSSFNIFSKALIFESAQASTWSTEDLGALASDENAKIDETLEMSAKNFYEVVPMSFTSKADSLITNEVLGVVFGDKSACGSCGDSSTGYNKIFAVTTAAGGSPSTPADVIFSLDGGANWAAHDVDSMLTAEIPTDIARIGDYIVVTQNTAAQTGSLHYALVSDFVNGYDPTFTKVTTGFVSQGRPNSICSIGRQAFIAGDFGYVYYTEDPTGGVTAVESGSLTTSKLNDVSALAVDLAMAVGNSGVVIYTLTGTSWALSPSNPVGFGVNLNTCAMKSATEWWVGTSAGEVWYTVNAGISWTKKTLPGTAPSAVTDIHFATDSVVFVSATVSSKGRLYRSFDGGYSFVALPEAGGSLPTNQRFNRIAVSPYNPNMVVAGGLGVTTDGILVLGQG